MSGKSHIRARNVIPAPTSVLTTDPANAHVGARRGIADGVVTLFDIVYETAPGGGQTSFKRADADAAASVRPPLYVALSGAADNGVLDVSPGPCTVPMDTTGASQGDYVYVSNTAGGKSLTAGTISQIIGIVRTANSATGDFTFVGAMATTGASGGSLSWPDGTAAAPGLPKASDPDTGLYGLGANAIGIAFGGLAGVGLKGGSAPSIAAAADAAGQDLYLRAPSAGGSATAARAGGRVDLGAGAGSAGTGSIAAGAGGVYSTSAGAGGASSGTGAGGAGGSRLETTGAGGAKTGTGAASGGAGGAWLRTAGDGGATASTSTGAGGNGGGLLDTAGNGGAATGAGSTGNGGTGGTLGRTGGVGGATVGGTAGAGGSITDTAGAGAAQANAVAGGTGGAFTLRGGAGGANSGGASGQAGGAGGNYDVGSGAGGDTDSTGAHAGGAAGTVYVRGAAGGNATAGTGNGGAGGNIDLIPGAGGTSAGGSAGLKGQVKVNGVALALPASNKYLATSVDERFFTSGRAYRVVWVRGTVTVAGTDGGAVTAVIRKVASGTAITAGQALHSGTYNLKGTADTVQNLTLTGTDADLLLADGDSLAVDYTGTLTSATGVITVGLLPV